MCYPGHSADSVMTSVYLFLSSVSDLVNLDPLLFLLLSLFTTKPSKEGTGRSHKETKEGEVTKERM